MVLLVINQMMAHYHHRRIEINDSDVVAAAMQSRFTFTTYEILLYEDRTFKRKVGIRGWYTS